MKKYFATIVAAVGVLTAYADTTASTAAAPALTTEIKYPWASSVSAGLSLTRGNSQTLLFSAEFLTQKKTLVNEYLFGAGGAYGTQDSSATVNNYNAFGQWNHLFSDKFYSYVRADYLSDQIADLDYRFTVGPGAGYYFIKNTNTFLAFEGGAGFEAQKLGGNEDNFATVRLAERFEHKFGASARFWEHVEYLPQVDDFGNYVVNFEIGVEAALTKTFSLKTYLDDNYQNHPAAGKKNNDIRLMAAVAYKF